MLTLNLQNIQDPLLYLRKQKLRALSLPSDYSTDVKLITPLGLTHEFTKVTSNLELVELIQELIDHTCDAMTIFCEQRLMYIRHYSHFAFSPTTSGRECCGTGIDIVV